VLDIAQEVGDHFPYTDSVFGGQYTCESIIFIPIAWSKFEYGVFGLLIELASPVVWIYGMQRTIENA
jgi:hypothetical protein